MSVSTFSKDPKNSYDSDFELEYLEDLDRILIGLCKETDGTLADIIVKSQGAFPTVVVERLKDLGLFRQSFRKSSTLDEGSRSAISPELHPLDFEWYFTVRCARQLARDLANFRGNILCMGTPTVAVALAELGRQVYLADRNPLLERRFPEVNKLLKFMMWDLNEPLPQLNSFEVVLFDSPWYLESIKLWLWQASRVVKQGGLILFSTFQPFLRPTARCELHSLTREAAALGETRVSPSALEYETPLFEHEALASSGLDMNVNWRRGDLFTIRKVRKTGVESQKPTFVNDDWDAFVIGDQVIKLRANTARNIERVLEPLDGCPGFVYPSVSLRDPARTQVDLWTSRNRVAKVGRRGIILDVLRQLAAGSITENRICELPILSLLSSQERDMFASRLSLILGRSMEKTNVPENGST